MFDLYELATSIHELVTCERGRKDGRRREERSWPGKGRRGEASDIGLESGKRG
jgi:hypothetical protein